MNSYNNKNHDRKYYGTAPGQSGPLVQRLDGYGKLWGLVVGPLGEGSKDLCHWKEHGGLKRYG